MKYSYCELDKNLDTQDCTNIISKNIVKHDNVAVKKMRITKFIPYILLLIAIIII